MQTQQNLRLVRIKDTITTNVYYVLVFAFLTCHVATGED